MAPHARVAMSDGMQARLQEIGVAQRFGKRPRRHRNDLHLRPVVGQARLVFGAAKTTGASPNARLDGNCGMRTNASASTSFASMRAEPAVAATRRATSASTLA